MIRKFPSLKEPAKYGYSFDTESYNYKAFFSERFLMFETYGDGLCQHSREWSVTVEFMADYMASLATEIMREPEGLITSAAWQFGGGPSVKDIEFAAGVVFKSAKTATGDETGYEKATRYFSVGERKVSTSSEKRYDKRYTQVEKWCDGSVDAIYRMLIPEHAKGMELYAHADAIRNWCLESDGKEVKRPYFYGGLPAQYLKWFDGDHRKAQDFRYAWNACKELFKAQVARDQAECCLSNLHWPEEKAATEAA